MTDTGDKCWKKQRRKRLFQTAGLVDLMSMCCFLACVIVMCVCGRVWLSEYSTGIRSTSRLTEGSLCRHAAPEPPCLPKPRCSSAWCAFLLFIPFPVRFLTPTAERGSGTGAPKHDFSVRSGTANRLLFKWRLSLTGPANIKRAVTFERSNLTIFGAFGSEWTSKSFVPKEWDCKG